VTNLSRRSFLFTSATALVGAALSFNPKVKLWVPEPVTPAPLAFHPNAFQMVMGPFTDPQAPPLRILTPNDLDANLELRDLALRVAKQMGERFADRRAMVLRELVGQQATPATPDGLIHFASNMAEATRQGRFVAEPHRLTATGRVAPDSNSFIKAMAYDLDRHIGWGHRLKMTAPISAELRPGDPFTDCDVVVATDHESGVSVRAVRWTQPGEGVLTSMEMAMGTWRQPWHRGPWDKWDDSDDYDDS